ncbi:MAG: helix-turn-helix domain-containing protein [Clostridiales bacterium]|nr:helix-turn-helix domain-containing protein [Clostridiales bacterium]
MTLGDLILRYRLEHSLSQRQFAAISNLSNGYISMLEKGINPNTSQPIVPTLPVLKKLADGMNTTIEDIFSKVDDMPVSLMADEHHPLPSNIIPMPHTYKVPLVGAIACGQPILAVEDADETVEVPEHINANFALRCKGDSMVGARIYDGDIVYIRSQPEVENGQIAAVRIGDEATLKKVRMYPDMIILEPANQAFEPLVYRREELNDIEILGKAVAFTSTIR